MAITRTSFVPGKPGGPGRPAGVQNKLNRTVKEVVMATFLNLQESPENSLIAWANREPTEFYKIAAKLIPTEVVGTVKTVFQVTLDEDKPDDYIQYEEADEPG